MDRYKKLVEEGRELLDDYHFRDLDEPAKLSAISYMRGLQDGKRLAQKPEKDKEPEPVAV